MTPSLVIEVVPSYLSFSVEQKSNFILPVTYFSNLPCPSSQVLRSIKYWFLYRPLDLSNVPKFKQIGNSAIFLNDTSILKRTRLWVGYWCISATSKKIHQNPIPIVSSVSIKQIMIINHQKFAYFDDVNQSSGCQRSSLTFLYNDTHCRWCDLFE